MLNLQEGKITHIYESDDFGSYFVIKPEAGKLIEYQVEMLTNNCIPGLLPMDLRCKNNEEYLYYKLTSKIPLSKLLSRKKINKRQLLDLLNQITQTMLTGIDYLLYNKCYILKQEFIYVDPAEFELYMVYVPIAANEDVNLNLRKLIIDLIINATYIEEDDSGDGFIQKIINYIKGDTFNITGLDRLLKQLNQDGSQDNIQKENNMSKYKLKDIAEAEDEHIASEHHLFDEIYGNEKFEKEIIREISDYNPDTNKDYEGYVKSGLKDFKDFKDSFKENPCKIHNLKLIAIGISTQVILLALFLLSKNFFESLGGNIKTTYAAAILIIAAIDALVIKNLLDRKKPAQKQSIKNRKNAWEHEERFNNINKNNIAEIVENEITNEITDDVLHNTGDKIADEIAGGIVDYDLAALMGENIITHNDPEYSALNPKGYPKHDFEYGNKTVVLFPQKELKPCIVNMTGNVKDEIPIEKDEFLIGRLEDMVDYVINNNAVGKVHAQITTRDNKYYLKDLNSINGTMINDVKLISNEENEIKDGDRITFANSDYLFVLR